VRRKLGPEEGLKLLQNPAVLLRIGAGPLTRPAGTLSPLGRGELKLRLA